MSRGGNFVIRATIGTDGKLSILDTTNAARRLQTGNLPSGVVMSRDGKRAYTNNELNTSVSALDLEHDTVLARDIESSAPPALGTVAHRRLLGKLAFFTALGLPDKLDENGDGSFDVPLRNVVPLEHRNKASDNGWSSCGSCHDDGHSDNVTWMSAPDHSARRHLRAQRSHGPAHPQLECRAGLEHRLQQQRPRHPGRQGFRDRRRRPGPHCARVQPRPYERRERFARRDVGVGRDGARAQRAQTLCN